jgi:hypothetical protein
VRKGFPKFGAVVEQDLSAMPHRLRLRTDGREARTIPHVDGGRGIHVFTELALQEVKGGAVSYLNLPAAYSPDEGQGRAFPHIHFTRAHAEFYQVRAVVDPETAVARPI